MRKHSPLKPDTNTTNETLHPFMCGLPYLFTPATNVTHVYFIVGDALDYKWGLTGTHSRNLHNG